MTRVEECTKADTGVGAAIAAGSHLEKGICALFVMAAAIMQRQVIVEREECDMVRIIQCPWLMVIAILTKIRTSPIRLVSAVIIPAANDFGFW